MPSYEEKTRKALGEEVWEIVKDAPKRLHTALLYSNINSKEKFLSITRKHMRAMPHCGPRTEAKLIELQSLLFNKKAEFVCELPQGYFLYREPNEVGGYRYISDEIGGGVVVWDTCLVRSSTLLAAIVEEERRQHKKWQESIKRTNERT